MQRTVVVSRAEERMKWALFATHTCPERKFAGSLAEGTHLKSNVLHLEPLKGLSFDVQALNTTVINVVCNIFW